MRVKVYKLQVKTGHGALLTCTLVKRARGHLQSCIKKKLIDRKRTESINFRMQRYIHYQFPFPSDRPMNSEVVIGHFRPRYSYLLVLQY